RTLNPEPQGARTTASDALVIGTVPYMSPEQARGKAVDTRTDVWAFGCVLYETLTGRRAFHGETPTDIIVKIASEEPDWSPLSNFPGTVSLGLQRIIRKCMEKSPSSRYQSARELAVDIAAIRRDLT